MDQSCNSCWSAPKLDSHIDLAEQLLWVAIAEQLEHQALNREKPGSKPLAAVLKLWPFCSSHIATVHSAV